MRKTAQLRVLLMAALLLLNSFLAITFSFGLPSDENRISSFGVVVRDGLIYAEYTFETGDLSEVQAQGQHYGGGFTEIVTSPVRYGKYACRFTTPNVLQTDPYRSKIQCGIVQPMKLTEAYFGFSVYIPYVFSLVDWFNMFEIAVPNAVAGGIIAALCPSSDDFYIWSDYPTGRTVWNLGSPLGKGTWHDIVVYVKKDVQGNVKVWLDGHLVCDMNYDTSPIQTTPDLGMFLEFGCYGSQLNPTTSLVFDEVRIASSNRF